MLNIDTSWLTNFFHRETTEEQESRLKLEAERLELQAVHAETVASLQKRISSAKKRITAVTGKSGSSGTIDFIFRHKTLVGIAFLIVVVFIVAKTCG